jgi:putative transcriptional regulator
MTITHHPSEAMLVGYAAGALNEGLSLLMAGHVALCPLCLENLGAAEAMGGALLEELTPERLAGDARDRVLSRLDEAAPPPRRAPPDFTDPLLPPPLADYFGHPLAALPWRWLMPGLRQVDLLPGKRNGENLRLLRLAPGRAMPRHGHGGSELTLVLAGAFEDEVGRFERGDLGEIDSAVVHQPRVVGKEDCICLIATDARLQFPGRIARFIQRFTGI